MTIAELEARMTYREFAEWAAYYRIEPWGEERADLRSGIQSATIANCNRGKNQQPFSPADFMPFAETKPESGEDEIRAKFEEFLGIGEDRKPGR